MPQRRRAITPLSPNQWDAVVPGGQWCQVFNLNPLFRLRNQLTHAGDRQPLGCGDCRHRHAAASVGLAKCFTASGASGTKVFHGPPAHCGMAAQYSRASRPLRQLLCRSVGRCRPLKLPRRTQLPCAARPWAGKTALEIPILKCRFSLQIRHLGGLVPTQVLDM